MPSIGTLGSTLPWGPKNIKVKRQGFPHNGSTGLKCPLQPAHLSQIIITGLEPRVQLDVAGRSENFLVDTGATYSVLTSYSGAFSSQPVLWVLQGKQLQKDSPKHFFVAGMDKSFPTSFWWPLRVLFLHWEEIFPSLQNPAAITVLIEDV